MHTGYQCCWCILGTLCSNFYMGTTWSKSGTTLTSNRDHSRTTYNGHVPPAGYNPDGVDCGSV